MPYPHGAIDDMEERAKLIAQYNQLAIKHAQLLGYFKALMDFVHEANFTGRHTSDKYITCESAMCKLAVHNLKHL